MSKTKIEELLKDIESNALVKEVRLTRDSYGERLLRVKLYPDQSQKQPEGYPMKAVYYSAEEVERRDNQEEIIHKQSGDNSWQEKYKPEKQEEWIEDVLNLIWDIEDEATVEWEKLNRKEKVENLKRLHRNRLKLVKYISQLLSERTENKLFEKLDEIHETLHSIDEGLWKNK